MDIDGIDTGDLPERLEQAALGAEFHDDLADADMPLHLVFDGWCAHRRATINEGMRRLTCKDCAADLDPFTYLLHLTRDTTRWVTARREAKHRADQALIRLTELLRQERNAKARARRRDTT